MKIPFFPNTGDGTHCFQAVLKMALAALRPDKEYSYDFLDKISNKQEGKWTWPTSAFLWLIDEGFEVRLIEEFDYAKFAAEGTDYISKKYGAEIARAQEQNSDIEAERKFARSFLTVADISKRVPELEDISELIAKNKIVIVNINSSALSGISGYSAHFVIVTEVMKNKVKIHDPGMPPNPDLVVSRSDFERAWAYPSERNKNVLAIGLKVDV